MAAIPIGQLSEDRLWQWDGKWVHAHRLDISCDRCESVIAVDEGKKEFKCPDGHRQDFIACKACKGTFQRPTESRQMTTRCPHCGSASLYVTTVSAWTWAADQSGRGQWPERSVTDPDRRVLGDFKLAAGGGTRIPAGSPSRIDFASAGMTVAGGGFEEFVPYSNVKAIQISGSTTNTSAGVFGGGFGVVGAVEGMLAASVINSLTSRRSVFSLLRVEARDAEYVFVSETVESGSLNMMLTPVLLRIRQAQAVALPASAPVASMADELTKLAQLREAGVLSDQEFAAAKARLLS